MGFRPDVAANDLTDALRMSDQRVGGTERQHDVPTGTVLDFDGTKLPPGFLYCDGSAISRAKYRGLFNVIGTTFGAGDGTTTFNLPVHSTAQGRITPDFGWNALSFGANISNYGGGYQAAQYLKDAAGFVHLRGLIAAFPAAVVNGMLLGTLPVGYRPGPGNEYGYASMGSYTGGSVAFLIQCHTDGTITYEQASGVTWNGSYLALSGITFDAGPGPWYKIIRV